MKTRVISRALAGIAALLAAGFVFTGSAAADPAVGACAWDAETNIQHCSFSSPSGIASVVISLDTPRGIATVVDETFDCETPVSVEFENLGPIHEIDVQSCPPDLSGQLDLPILVVYPELPPDPVRELHQPLQPQAQRELLILITPRIVK